MIETAVIIANWNGKKYLKDCFDSLAKQTYQNFKIIFVDNGSSDDSVDFVERNYPETKIIQFKKNTGFCFGYNTGIKKALEENGTSYIFILNNDTKLHEKFIENMINCSKAHPKAGSIQSKVLNFYEPNKIDCVGIILARDGTAHNRGYEETDEGQYENEDEIFGANATAVLYTKESLEKTKLPGNNYFDRGHFAYYEDVDLAWRMRLAGFKAYLCPKAIVWHVHSGSTGKSSLFKAYYLHRNHFFAIFKNYPTGIMMRVLGWRFLSYARLIFDIFQKNKKASEYATGQGKIRIALTILRAWGSVIYNLPGIIEKRRLIQKNKIVNKEEILSWLVRFRKND